MLSQHSSRVTALYISYIICTDVILNHLYFSYNGHLISGDKGRRRSKYILWKREKANGVKPSQRHLVTNPQASKVNNAPSLQIWTLLSWLCLLWWMFCLGMVCVFCLCQSACVLIVIVLCNEAEIDFLTEMYDCWIHENWDI